MRKCPVCAISGFDDVDELRQHRRDAHPERVALCSCGRSFLEQRYMQQHLNAKGSGSLGKGTSVKGQSDVDLILMLNDYDDVGLLFRNLPSVLNELEKFLIVKTSANHKETTRFSVQVTMRCGDHMHEVDILPGVDLTKIGFTTTDIFREMRDVSSDMLHEYSVSLAPLQLDIMKALPTKVKSLIRLVKYWKNDKLKGSFDIEASSFSERCKPAWPSSYALELVVLNAWLEAGHPNSFDMTRALHSVLTSLVNHSSLRVLLRGLMEYSPDMARHGSGPYIMDPVNPYNDMYHGLVNGKAFDWDLVAVKARNWLGKGLFAGFTGNTQRQW